MIASTSGIRPVPAQDEDADGGVPEDVAEGVLERLVLRVGAGVDEVVQPGELVVEPDAQAVERPARGERDVQRTVVPVLGEEQVAGVLEQKTDLVLEGPGCPKEIPLPVG